MAVNISQLVNKEIRAKVPVIIGDVKNFITVFNPNVEQRHKFREFLDKKVNGLITENKSIVLDGEELIRLFYKELTDLEIKDEDKILEILKNPRPELVQVSKHIEDIIHELVLEIILTKKAQLHRLQEFKQQNETVKATKDFLESLGLGEKELGEAGIDLNEDKIKINTIEENKNEEKTPEDKVEESKEE